MKIKAALPKGTGIGQTFKITKPQPKNGITSITEDS